MDVRDLEFWEREASRREIERRMSAMISARMANASNDAFRQEMMNLEYTLKLMDREEKKT